MKAIVKIGPEVEKVNLTLEITMPVEHWRQVMRQMPGQFPSNHFGALISRALGHAIGIIDRAGFEVDPFGTEEDK